jgi:drug/metabolite transporter (DMT)-like permease
MPRPVASSAPFPLAGPLAALASSVLWAGAGIVFRTLRGRVPPLAVNLAKNAIAAVLLAVTVAVVPSLAWPTAFATAPFVLLAISGIVGLTVCDSFFLRSIMEIGPRRATLIALLAPCLVFVGSLLPPLSQFDEVASVRPWAGFLLAVLGVALAATGAAPSTDEPHDPVRERRGVRDALLAAVFQAVGVLLARRAIELGADPIPGALLRLAAGSVGLVLVGVATGALPAWKASLSVKGILPLLAVTAFFGTFLGIGLNQISLAWSPSTGISTVLNSLAPVWLIPLSFVFLGERPTRRGLVATALALGGVGLLSF